MSDGHGFRPQSLTPMVARRIDVDAWVGWLLRTHRLAARPGVSDVAFGAQLAAAGYPADASFVGRCEAGQDSAPEAMITAYERVLGLPPGQLTSVCEGARFALAGQLASPPDLTRSEVVDRLALVDARIEGATATGADWLTLTTLADGPHPVMLPPRLARTWVRQLLAETVRAARSARTTRIQALCRLVRNPQTKDAVVDVVFDLVATPGAAGMATALGVIGTSADPRLIDRLITTLEEPCAHARRAAAHALLTPISQDRLTASQRARIGEGVLGVCRHDPQRAATAVVLASRLSPGLVRQATSLLGHDPRPLHHRQQPSPELYARLTEARHDLDPKDPVLAQLLHAALVGHFPERRHHALQLLGASPYRSALADRATGLIATSDDPVTRSTAAMTLPYLAGSAQQRGLLDLLSGSSPLVRPSALQALAHGAEIPPWFSLRPHLRDPLTQTSAVFAAGMSGHPDLAAATDADCVSAQVRQSARWWMAHGTRVEDAPATA
ncbi:hypothetical protein [Leekyejoonella antrihumi]|uniref:Uncharacterized protein n=1 Tax=Leekyejoonella antrihumi TaxID=1660198 RepID=A0A563E049_9MICO|nr:hypothetical protein [Leekyejoonella antrihumi]TWP35918.1 hypothetical protein FGL98_11835 [Leekyejoonella antrihumi]